MIDPSRCLLIHVTEIGFSSVHHLIDTNNLRNDGFENDINFLLFLFLVGREPLSILRS